MVRWGVTGILERTMKGLALLSTLEIATTTREIAWYEVLQVDRRCSLATAEEAYKTLAWEKHPDRGGQDGEMAQLNKAIETRRSMDP